MTVHKPLWIQPASGDPDNTYTGAEMRALIAALYPVQGVVASSSGLFAVGQRGAGANLSVDIAAGMAAITGDDIAGQGSYLVWSDAVSNLVLPAAPGSGTRFHRVGLRIRDKSASGSWTTYDCIPDYVADSGSGLPAEPASFLTLAQAQIASGQSSYATAQITDMRSYTGLGPWTTLGTLAGYSVSVGRYRFNWGDVEVEVAVTPGGANAASVSFSVNLPVGMRLGDGQSSTAFPLTTNLPASMGAAGGPPRIVGTSGGAVAVAAPANSSGGAFYGTVFIPTI